MKRLEFKSILARFDVQEMGGNSVEEHFWSVEDLSERSRFLKKAECGAGGMSAHLFRKWGGLTICIGEEEIYTIPAAGFLTGSYLCDHLEELIAQRRPNQEPVAVLVKTPASVPESGLWQRSGGYGSGRISVKSVKRCLRVR